MRDENEIKENEEKEEEIDAADYIEELRKIKEGMISKKEYEKVISENRKLAKALANGDRLENNESAGSETAAELRKKLFVSRSKNNLEYFNNVLKLRKKVMEEGGEDPFLPYSHDYIATEADRDQAEEIANIIEECIDFANGNSHTFTLELKRRCDKYKK